MLTSTFVRMLACMTCVFGLPYLCGPLVGMSRPLAVGAAGAMMGVIPQLLPAQARRHAIYRCLAAFAGVACASALMTALHGILLAQAVLFVCLLSLPVLGPRIHPMLGAPFIQGMIGSALMTLLTGQFVEDAWGLWGQFMALMCLVMGFVAFVVTGLVRRPPEVLRQAKKSLLFVHEDTAAAIAAHVRSPSPRHRRRLARSLERSHRCALAIEAAMAGTRGFPAPIGDALQHAAYDIDLTLNRIARIVVVLAEDEDVALAGVRRRLAEIMGLLSVRDASSLSLATELIGGLDRTITRSGVRGRTRALAERLPALAADLIGQIVDGGIAGARANAWLAAHPGVAHRARWDSWVPRDHVEQGAVEGEEFVTGVSYVGLEHAGDAPHASKAVGSLNVGRVAVGLAERQALQTFLAVSAASLVGWLISGTHFFWASFGAFVVLIGTTTTSSRLRKIIRRVVGTIIGACAGVALAMGVGQAHPLVCLAAMIVFSALAFTIVKRNYALFSVLLTAMVMQIYVLTAAPLMTYAWQRVAENIVGAFIAGIVASFILPLHTSTVMRTVLDSLAEALAQTLDAVEGVVKGQAGARPRIAARAVEDAAAATTQLASAMLGPFAGTSGAWVRQIASRVPAVVSAAKDVAHTAGDIRDGWEATPVCDVDADDVGQVIDEVRTRARGIGVIRDFSSETGGFTVSTEAVGAILSWRTELGDAEAVALRQLVHELVGLDSAVRQLTAAAWHR